MNKLFLSATALIAALVFTACKSNTGEISPLTAVDEANLFYEVNCAYTSDDLEALRESTDAQEIEPGKCAGYVSADGNLQGRNLDWTYDNKIHVLATNYNSEALYKSIGMSTGLGEYADLKDSNPKLIIITDGINEKGLIIQHNVVPGHDMLAPSYVKGAGKGDKILPTVLIPRYVLDSCATIAEALTFLNHYKIVANKAMVNGGYDSHFLISDATGRCGVIEFADGEIIYTEDEHIMTNLYNFTRVKKGEAIMQSKFNGFDLNKYKYLSNGYGYYLTDGSAGIERHETLLRFNPTTVDEMKKAMESVWYTYSYDKDRYAKYLEGQDYLTCPIEEMFWRSEYGAETDEQIAKGVNDFEMGNRDKLDSDWYTSFTVVYDRPNFTLHVTPSQSGKYYTYTLKK